MALMVTVFGNYNNYSPRHDKKHHVVSLGLKKKTKKNKSRLLNNVIKSGRRAAWPDLKRIVFFSANSLRQKAHSAQEHIHFSPIEVITWSQQDASRPSMLYCMPAALMCLCLCRGPAARARFRNAGYIRRNYGAEMRLLKDATPPTHPTSHAKWSPH